MRLLYSECSGAGNIMKDFVKFKKVSDYLQNLLDIYSDGSRWGELEMCPSDCAYRDVKTGETRWIVKGGYVHDDAQKNINVLKRQRRAFDNFISDYLVITASAFERECFFSWD